MRIAATTGDGSMSIRHHLGFAPRLGAVLFFCAIAPFALGEEKSKEAALVLQGTTGKPIRITASEVKSLPHIEIETADHKGTKTKFSGVPIRALLDKIGVPHGEDLRGEWLRAFVTVDADDDYRAVFSLVEFDPAFTDRTIILADTRDDKPLPKGRAPFQVVVPGEKRHARWVFRVKEIRVVDSRSVKD